MTNKNRRIQRVQKQRRGDTREQLKALERGHVPLNTHASVRMALVFPNTYNVGMASVGFQTVYYLLNKHPGVCCERAFALGIDGDKEIRTFETGTPIQQCDVVAFTLAFELDIPNVLKTLIQSNIAPLSIERSSNAPIIVMGGVVAGLNPSPLLPFMDGLLAGEGEGIFYDLCDVFYQCKQEKKSRTFKLKQLSELSGFYVPGISETVNRRVVHNLQGTEAFTPIISPESHFKDMFVVEVGRGCRRGCFFCAAQHVYDPFRIRSRESILKTIKTYNPGSQRIGLESAGLSDYPDLHMLIDDLVRLDYHVSFSSIRADCVTPELLKQIERSGTKSFTIAPEAGNQMLRTRIGKGISQDKLMQTVEWLSQSGIDILKLYFLIGLPSETMKDVESIGALVQEIANCFRQYEKRKQLRISVNAFVPKPFTEFQWASMEEPRLLNEKRQMIGRIIGKIKNVTITSKSTRLEQMQGLLALGDARVGEALHNHLITQRSWNQVVKEYGIDLNGILWKPKTFDSTLPWQMIQDETSFDFLWKRYQTMMPQEKP